MKTIKSILSISMLIAATVVLSFCATSCNNKKKSDAPKIVIKTDLSKLQIGDCYYSDGTFSTGQDSTKICIGIVFSLKTSKDDQAKGFSHGKIVALMPAANSQELEWGTLDKQLPSPFGKYPWRNWTNASSVMNGYACTHSSAVKGADYKIFKVIKNFAVELPAGKSNGWYLPSIGEWAEIITNIGKTKIDNKGYFDYGIAQENLKAIGIRGEAYWSSTQVDKDLAWFVSFAQGSLTGCSKDTRNRARLVAAI
jgi:hypothetical protein